MRTSASPGLRVENLGATPSAGDAGARPFDEEHPVTPTSRFPRALVPGAVLALLSVLLGYGLGGVFGANEEAILARLKSSGAAVLDTTYAGDQTKLDQVVAKSWTYQKRAHLHWGAMGAVAIGIIALLAAVGGGGVPGTVAAWSLGAGGVLYGLFWLLAGFSAPGLGGTGQAKEAWELVAVPGAGLSIVGVVMAIVVVVRHGLRP